MKSSYIYILFFSFIFMASCVKDDSTHDLETLNQIEINDTTATGVILQFDTLTIVPEIEQSIPVPEDELLYAWTLRAEDGYGDLVFLDSSRNLHKPIGVLPGDYTVTYRVTVKSTGVMFMKLFPLKVINRFSLGWLLLEDNSGTGDISIVLPNDTVVNHIYSELNPGEPLNMPLKEIGITDTYAGKYINIFSENQGIRLDYDVLLKDSEMKDWFWEAPTNLHPEKFTRLSSSLANIINNGLLHIYVAGGFPGDVKYMNALPFPGGKGADYALAPFIGIGPGPYDGKTSYTGLYYDTKTKGFLYLTGASLIPQFQFFNAPTASGAFNMNEIGKELLSMDLAYKANMYNNVFKDENGELFLYQVELANSEPATLMQNITAVNPSLKGATMFASSVLLPQVYCVKGQDIYLYEIPSNTSTPILSIAAGETITKLKINSTSMQVATWDGAQGHFYIYDIDAYGKLSLSKEFSGFGKIVDFVYKG